MSGAISTLQTHSFVRHWRGPIDPNASPAQTKVENSNTKLPQSQDAWDDAILSLLKKDEVLAILQISPLWCHVNKANRPKRKAEMYANDFVTVCLLFSVFFFF
jgi:hypothetical protein